MFVLESLSDYSTVVHLHIHRIVWRQCSIALKYVFAVFLTIRIFLVMSSCLPKARIMRLLKNTHVRLEACCTNFPGIILNAKEIEGEK